MIGVPRAVRKRVGIPLSEKVLDNLRAEAGKLARRYRPGGNSPLL
jgi:hypothetical protein